MRKTTIKFERYHTLWVQQMEVGWTKISHFWFRLLVYFQQVTCYNSNTVQDSRIVSFKVYRMVMLLMTLGDP